MEHEFRVACYANTDQWSPKPWPLRRGMRGSALDHLRRRGRGADWGNARLLAARITEAEACMDALSVLAAVA